VFWDASENIVFLDMVKRAAPTRRGPILVAPGMAHVSFGPGASVGEHAATARAVWANPPVLPDVMRERSR
jgi:hypothetical protein